MAERALELINNSDMALTTGEIAEELELSKKYTARVLNGLLKENKIVCAPRSGWASYNIRKEVLTMGERNFWFSFKEADVGDYAKLFDKINDIRYKSLKVSESRIDHLESLKTKVGQDEGFTDEEKNRLLKHVEGDINKEKKYYASVEKVRIY